jgi:hypothetical protein
MGSLVYVPHLPEHTHLFRLSKSHSYLMPSSMSEPTLLGMVNRSLMVSHTKSSSGR